MSGNQQHPDHSIEATVDKIHKLVIGFAALWVLSHLNSQLNGRCPAAVALIRLRHGM
jgi:hypothetical protein